MEQLAPINFETRQEALQRRANRGQYDLFGRAIRPPLDHMQPVLLTSNPLPNHC